MNLAIFIEVIADYSIFKSNILRNMHKVSKQVKFNPPLKIQALQTYTYNEKLKKSRNDLW
jgi:hypothetical protein